MKPLIVALFCLLCPGLSWGDELQDENLLQTLPAEYKMDYEAKQGNTILSEMVPQTESVDNWTEMLTTQVFLGMKNVSPEKFQTRVQKRWLSACKNG
jgi:hypothetical protein